MKNVLIVGATGSLAKFVVDALQKLDDIHLTLLARNISNITKETTSAKIVQGDVMDYTNLKDAVEGQDIVYVNLAGNLEAMTKNIVKAMNEAKAKRIIAISSIGIYETPLKSVLVPYRKLADVIEASGLDFTILRPDWFTNSNEVNYTLTEKGTPEKGSAISRKSIAAFVATLVQNPELHKNENLGISKP
ncbi:NAD-dependent dehydratase [Pedobacter yonginense]|uniref:NAD-dependent dehydratase n=1 Tax=Pedobacter yonginense TaxID=651869 RepID=A0A317ENQ8_9SPHI|nr:NAD(P)H-binding protein [Pedobacter yonginense]PWS27533.1 NAD-dependent dehydratase [Pedobacter yonginense]